VSEPVRGRAPSVAAGVVVGALGSTLLGGADVDGVVPSGTLDVVLPPGVLVVEPSGTLEVVLDEVVLDGVVLDVVEPPPQSLTQNTLCLTSEPIDPSALTVSRTCQPCWGWGAM
jgi:hypothetical protein